MADTEDPEVAPLVPPQNVPHPQAEPQQTTGLVDTWRQWINDPHNRAAMMQFGAALSQPISAGQNRMGQIGQAFGQAGEASDRVTAMQQREEELASKQDLRSAQAEAGLQRAAAAETRAAAAGQRADWGLEKLQLAQQLAELRRTQGDANARIRAKAIYDAAVTNANIYGTAPPGPFEQWYQELTAGTGASAVSGPAATNSVNDQKALDWANKNPDDPRAAAIKKRLGVQ